MEVSFTQEQKEQAMKAQSPEELLALAKENGVDLTPEAAGAIYAKLQKQGELSDEELDNVAGGGCGGGGGSRYLGGVPCPRCHRETTRVIDVKTGVSRYYCSRCDVYA